ncbi:MAG: hypothetical protein KJZ68_06480 [Phycisphaerales bacterium]|nr:hypothetical protein [Phycisphaerales bacterium]
MSVEAAMQIVARIRVTYSARITVSRAEMEDGAILVQMTARRVNGRLLVAREPDPLAAARRLEELLLLDDRNHHDVPDAPQPS